MAAAPHGRRWGGRQRLPWVSNCCSPGARSGGWRSVSGATRRPAGRPGPGQASYATLRPYVVSAAPAATIRSSATWSARSRASWSPAVVSAVPDVVRGLYGVLCRVGQLGQQQTNPEGVEPSPRTASRGFRHEPHPSPRRPTGFPPARSLPAGDPPAPPINRLPYPALPYGGQTIRQQHAAPAA